MSKLSTLFKCMVVSSMTTGFRRAGIALDKGLNEVPLDENQIKQFENDPNMSIEIGDVIDIAKGAALGAAASKLGVNADTLTNVVDGVTELVSDIKDSKQDDFHSELDLTNAPEALHPYIVILDLLSQEAPLTNRPSCKELTIEVDDKKVTPSKAEADEAWQWYQDNVLVVDPFNEGDK